MRLLPIICVAALALAGMQGAVLAQANQPAATADDAAEASNLESQIAQIAALTEIGSLAVVSLREQEEDDTAQDVDQEPAASEGDDVLLSGLGERRMMTASDPDEAADVIANEAEQQEPTSPDQAVESSAAPPLAEATGDGVRQRSRLQQAIEENAVLGDALAERDVDLDDVVGIEVRDGTTVIVYTGAG